MSSERGYRRDLLKSAALDVYRDVQSAGRRAVNDHVDDAYAAGFQEAVNICLSVLSESNASLLEKIEPGKGLSKEEQFLLRRLNELKTEMETRVGRHGTTSRT